MRLKALQKLAGSVWWKAAPKMVRGHPRNALRMVVADGAYFLPALRVPKEVQTYAKPMVVASVVAPMIAQKVREVQQAFAKPMVVAVVAR